LPPLPATFALRGVFFLSSSSVIGTFAFLAAV
jgi:hypothetical protein